MKQKYFLSIWIRSTLHCMKDLSFKNHHLQLFQSSVADPVAYVGGRQHLCIQFIIKINNKLLNSLWYQHSLSSEYLWRVSVRIHLLLSLAWKQKLLLFRWFPLPSLTSNVTLVGLSDNPLDIKLKRSPWHLLASPHKGVKVDISRRVNIVLCRLSVLKQSIVKSNTSFTICPVKKYGSIPKRWAFAWLLKRKKIATEGQESVAVLFCKFFEESSPSSW